jgi:hypothetical protein
VVLKSCCPVLVCGTGTSICSSNNQLWVRWLKEQPFDVKGFFLVSRLVLTIKNWEFILYQNTINCLNKSLAWHNHDSHIVQSNEKLDSIFLKLDCHLQTSCCKQALHQSNHANSSSKQGWGQIHVVWTAVPTGRQNAMCHKFVVPLCHMQLCHVNDHDSCQFNSSYSVGPEVS